MQCRNCSGNEFKQTKTGNFKCSYCSTLYYEETKSNSRLDLQGLKKFMIPASGLIILTFSVIVISLFNLKSKPEGEISSFSSSGSNGSTFTNEEKLPQPSGEIFSIDALPDIIGNVYFLAMCRNNGKVAINKPEVTIRLLSEKGEKVATGKGYAFADRLNPGEITPVYILVTNCPAYNKYETDFAPELPFIIPEGGVFQKNFSGEFSEVSLKQTDSYNNHKLRGKIKNISQYDAKYVQVAAILYDKNDKAVGYGSTYISEKILKPGSFDFFEIYLTTVTAVPEYYKLYFEGNVD